jgi:hypothetical protein
VGFTSPKGMVVLSPRWSGRGIELREYNPLRRR